MINPELKVGDRIILLHMEDEYGPVPMGTEGTVKKIVKVFGETHYEIDWDNGSRLSLIPDVDKWDIVDNIKNRLKKKLNEMTSSNSGGKYRVPLVLAPQLWNNEQMGAFTEPVSKYLNADLSYDSYDKKMERSKKQIKGEEKFARKKAKMAKMMFSQNDGDGNPINGYSPEGNKEPGTPKYIEKIANLPKSEKKLVINNRKVKLKENNGEFEKNKKLLKNIDVFKFFNMRFLKEYLIAVRDSGIVNMFGASPYLYMGSERIEHQFKYQPIPNEDEFEKVLEMADQAQAEMINGVIKVLESKNIEPDLDQINRYLNRYSLMVLENYMLLF